MNLNYGTTYEFKIKSRNQYDLSDYSETIQLLCAFIAEIPTDVTTVIESQNVKVTWNLPSENGTPITAYKVYILDIAS